MPPSWWNNYGHLLYIHKGMKQSSKYKEGILASTRYFTITRQFQKRTFACLRLKNDFPSFLSSLYVRTTNIYWWNSNLFSTTHPTFLHSCPFRRSTEHILFRAISLVGKIFGTYLACSSLCTANPFRIERPIKREF